MDRNGLGDILGDSTANHLHDELETALTLRPDGLPLPVEVALAQYAESIEGMSTSAEAKLDPYTRGFVAGLRAAIKVVANVSKS